jgi:hypothetical protein
MKTAHLTWESKWGSKAWKITGPEDVRIPFHQPWLSLNQPKPLSAHSAGVRFRQLLKKNPDFTQYWARATGGYGVEPIRFIFHGGEKAWRLPWELLLDGFEEKDMERMERVVVTRGNGDTRIIQPSEFAEPLRVQVVLGDNSGQRGARLRLEEERAKLSEIYGGLETGVRDNVRLLECTQPTLDELPELLRQGKPDVLWFSGHGLPNPPVFCLKTLNGKVRDLTPALLARFIRETQVRPIYVIFLACHLALDGQAEQFGSAPEFFKELVPCGVQGMLIMQGAINDHAAVRLATALFRHLAVGRPLDWAVASARPIVRQAMTEKSGSSVDWARPAVWSNGVPPDELSLNFANSDRAQRQVAARQILRARLTAPAELDVAADAASCARATGWLGLAPPRLQLVATPKHAAGQSLWIRLLLALQSISGQSVIAIELEAEETALALRVWAEAVHEEAARWYEPFLRSTELLSQMADDPQKTWRELCATEDIIIAVRDDTERELEPWFLAPLEKRVKTLTLLWRTKPLSAAWPIEPLDMQPYRPQQLITLAQNYQPLLNSMAVVGMPVRESWLRGAGLAQDLKKEIGEVLVDTEAGAVLNATASLHFASAMNEEERKEAHLDCMRILDHLDVHLQFQNPAVRLLRLRHCLAARRNEDAVKECQLALAEMRQRDRPWSALEIGITVEHLYRIFPATVSLHLAWAAIMTGDLNVGKTWLKRAKEVETPLEKAWYHGLMAEVAKSEGKKQKALEEIEGAIAIVEGQPLEGRDAHLVQLRRYAYRQDRARIYQYLFYEHAKARQEYEKLQEELADGSEPHLLAAVRRNYSECLRSIARGIGDADWKRAKDIVDEEIGKLANEPDVPIYAELLYERARIALKEDDRATADAYLQRCLQAAERSHFAMISAIARARRFWEFEAFDLANWQSLESQLNVHHRHGWAVRSAMNGRLRAAKRLEQGNPAVALELLRRNVEKAVANPGFDGRSDRERIAQSYAGLAVIGRDPRRWNSFIESHPWAADWIGRDASRNAVELWKGVH